MTDLQKKLGWRDHFSTFVFHCPPELDLEFPDGENKEPRHATYDMVIGFVLNSEEILEYSKSMIACSKGERLWMAFPKKSGSIVSDISRDHGWEPFLEKGLRPVAAVSINSDWSVIRFRMADRVKTSSKNKYTDAPAELSTLLMEFPGAMEKYSALAPSHKKEYHQWIGEAKRMETKNIRLKKTIEMLLSGKRNPSEK